MKRLSGFSLMEMMVVLLIVAVVAAASAPMVNKKMLNAAAEKSPWVWTGLNNSIAYNIQGQQAQSATIGAIAPPEGFNPRLYINRDDVGPHITFGSSGSNVNLSVNNGGIHFTNNADSIGTGAVAIGNTAAALNTDDIAIGRGARSNGTQFGGVAIGVNSNANSGRSATALGPNSNASASSAISIGNEAQSSGVGSIAIGGVVNNNDSNFANGNYSVAIGADSQTTARAAIAFGPSTRAGVNGSIAIGAGATVAATSGAVSINENDLALLTEIKEENLTTCDFEDKFNIPNIGQNEEESNLLAADRKPIKNGRCQICKEALTWDDVDSGLAHTVSSFEVVEPAYHVTCLEATRVCSKESIHDLACHAYYGPMGRNRGHSATDTDRDGLCNTCDQFDEDPTNTPTQPTSDLSTQNLVPTEGVGPGIAIGVQAEASSNSIAIGSGVSASRTSSIAIGGDSRTRADGPWSLSIGVNTISEQDASTAVGCNAVATGKWSSAFGVDATAWGQSAVAVGGAAHAEANNSLAVGDHATATGAGSTAIGFEAKAWHQDSVAIGKGATTSAENQIVLGTPSDIVYIPGKLVVAGATFFGVNEGTTHLRLKKQKLNGARSTETVYMELIRDHSAADDAYVECMERVGGATIDKYAGWRNCDRRLKDIGEVFTAGLDEIKKLEVFNFTYKKDPDKTPRVGVMAQDLQKIFPNAVFEGKDGFLRIRMEDMFYALVNAVKQLDAKIEEIKNNQIAQLLDKVVVLEKENKKQEEMIEKLIKQNEEIIEQNKDLSKQCKEIVKQNKDLKKALKKGE